MNDLARNGSRGIVFILLVLMPTLAQAQSQSSNPVVSPADRLDVLEQRLQKLDDQAAELRREIQQLRAELGPPSAEAVPEGEAEDLMAIEPVAEPADSKPEDLSGVEPVATTKGEAPTAVPQTLDSALKQNPVSAGASKAFNPDISIIGNFVGSAGDLNPVEDRKTFSLQEAEIGLQAFVDPYAYANFFIGISPEEGVSVEEGYAEFIALPGDLTAKVGKMKASFGKFNLSHFHTWSWVDAPLVMERFFGEEGIADSGISVSRIFPNRFDLYVEGTAEVFGGSVDGVFDPIQRDDLLYVGHLKTYHDLTESSNVELGASWAGGTLADAGGPNRFYGIDATYRWKPLARSVYRSFLARTEIVRNDRANLDRSATGFYLSGDYQFAQRWIAGLRIDQTNLPDHPSLTDRSQSLVLTFRPSEFSLLRGQLRRFDYAGFEDGWELLGQLQFAIGAHGAHKF